MTDFPIDTVIFGKIIEVFNQTRSYVLLLFPLAFFIRIVFGFIFLRANGFIDILKDSLFLFLGLFFFTDILKMTLQIPYFISSELSIGDWRNINLGEGIFTKSLKKLVDWIGILSYWISFGLYVVIVSILGFFAGYILFLGTMFRAYGMLKVFFILLFTVSLWPLLWHSINFAVFSIAVSDNALANNVIVGGASLAKVFIPIWLISKTSTIPVAETLKKVSFTGGSLAGAGGLALAGGSKTTHFLSHNIKNHSQNQNVQSKAEVTNEGVKINIPEAAFKEGKGAFINKEPEDFSIRENEALFLPEENKEDTPQGKVLSNEKGGQSPKAGQSYHIESDFKSHVETEVLQESHISGVNSNEGKQEIFIENSPQIHKELRETQNISQNHNESILNEATSQKELETASQETVVTEYNQKVFNEAIHREEWIEEEGEGENYIAPRHHKKDRDREL